MCFFPQKKCHHAKLPSKSILSSAWHFLVKLTEAITTLKDIFWTTKHMDYFEYCVRDSRQNTFCHFWFCKENSPKFIISIIETTTGTMQQARSSKHKFNKKLVLHILFISCLKIFESTIFYTRLQYCLNLIRKTTHFSASICILCGWWEAIGKVPDYHRSQVPTP